MLERRIRSWRNQLRSRFRRGRTAARPRRGPRPRRWRGARPRTVPGRKHPFRSIRLGKPSVGRATRDALADIGLIETAVGALGLDAALFSDSFQDLRICQARLCQHVEAWSASPG